MGKRIMNVELGLLPWRVLNLGYVGENEHTQIVIDCTEVLLDYPQATCSMVVKPPRGDLYPVTPTKSGNTFIWEITASDVVYAGSGQIQLTFYNGEEIIRSDIGSTKVAASLETTGDAPEPLQNWMDAAEETARQIAEDAAEGVVDDLADAKDEAIAAIEAKGQEVIEDIPSDYSELSDDVDDLKSALNVLDEETVKTVNGTYPDENGDVSISVIMSNDAADLFGEVLSEALYGTDQRDNISSLIALIKGHTLVSLSAELDGLALVGMNYSDLDITVTGTYSDGSTAEVFHYTISSGTVVQGTNTVTISYRGISTTLTFTGELIVTFSIAYNLTDVTSSNHATIIEANERYQTTLSIAEDYCFSSVIVTMGNVDITNTAYVNGTVIIAEVTGNVVISATALEYQYLDPLFDQTGANISYIIAYSDDGRTQIGRNNYTSHRFISEYPASADCVIHYKFKNISDAAIPLENIFIGGLPSLLSTQTTAYTNNVIWYATGITNISQSLGAGDYLEGDFNVKAGYQIGLMVKNDIIGKYEITLRGSFVANEFEDYTEYIITDSSENYGAYRKVSYMNKDNQEITAINNFKTLLSDSLATGSYDAIVITDTNIADGFAAGMVATDTDATAYGSVGTNYSIEVNIWYRVGTLEVTQNYPNLITQRKNYKLLLKKVVNE